MAEKVQTPGDYYLTLDGIKGESVIDGHQGEITVLSWKWDATQTTAVAGTGGSGAGKAKIGDIRIEKYVDIASTPLFRTLLEGRHIVTGLLTANKAGGKGPFLKVTLGDLFVTKIETSGISEIPTETVSFSYRTIRFEYSKQSETGLLTAAGAISYDLKANRVS